MRRDLAEPTGPQERLLGDAEVTLAQRAGRVLENPHGLPGERRERPVHGRHGIDRGHERVNGHADRPAHERVDEA